MKRTLWVVIILSAAVLALGLLFMHRRAPALGDKTAAGKGTIVETPEPPPAPKPPVLPSTSSDPASVEALIRQQQEAATKAEAAELQTNKQRASFLMTQALAATDPQQQKDLYEQVIQLDPANANAVQGFSEAQRKIAGTQAATTALESNHRSQQDAVDAAFRHLKTGKMAFSVPESMKSESSDLVVASLGTADTSSEVMTNGFAHLAGHTLRTETSLIGVRMRMQLAGGDFDIKGEDDAEQAVFGDHPAIWHWQITPHHAGKLQLRLTARAVIDGLPGGATTVDRDINVSVNASGNLKSFVEKNWQWLATTLAAGVGLVWKFFGPKAKKSDD